MAHSSIPRRRTARRYFYIVALVLLAIAGWLWYLGNRPATIANAQVGTLIDDANTPITGGWQIGEDDNDSTAFNSEKYRLWAYKNFGRDSRTIDYNPGVFCAWYRVPVYDSAGNEIDIRDMTFGGEDSSTIENINSVPDRVTGRLPDVKRMENLIRGLVEVRVNDFKIELFSDRAATNEVDSPYKQKCFGNELNANIASPGSTLADNLNNRPGFLQSQELINAGWLTGIDPTQWPASPSTILNQEPFLVLGNTETGGSGFINHSLELNLWVPDYFDLRNLELKTDNLCDDTAWDTSGGNADFSVWLEGASGSVKLIDETNCDSSTGAYGALGQHELISMGIDISSIGGDLGERNLTTKSASGTQDDIYKRYKIIAQIDVPDSDDGYSNQFRIAVANPTNSYLGIGRTGSDSGGNYRAETALSTSSRLPEVYDRLEVLWETEIYLAADAEKGCSGQENERIGFYDSDYPTVIWNRYNGSSGRPDLKPEIEIYSADRNLFLGNHATTFNYEDTLIFDGYENGRYVAHNDWEYENFTFEFHKIYRLKFRNIDQRTWIQIGLPYDQINALQKCIDRPLVKVYHGGVSAGGRFGSGKTISTCRDDDLSLGPEPAAIYAHAEEGVDGSSAEYSVQARGVIDAFYSGFKSGPAPMPPNRLTFANSADPWGGNFGGELRCMPNWWRETDQLGDSLPDTSLDLSSHANSDIKRFYEPTGGLLSLGTGGTADLALKAVIYVKGDLLITENINNLNQGLSKLNQIKSIYLIVQGNIFIEPNVTQIDAVLIAMPTDFNQATDGRIFTCYIQGVTNNPTVDLHDASAPTSGLAHAGQCIHQLTINGALVARQIRLGRVTSSDPSSPAFINDSYPVSEIINLLPEYYVGTPLLPAHSEWFYNSDSITILPINF